MNRRKFVKTISTGAVAVGASLLGDGAKQVTAKSNTISQEKVAPSDEVRLGIIGPGSRGQELMRHFLRVPGVSVRALCDIYEPRFAGARRITKEETPVYTDYRKLLEQRDLDAIVVATPPGLHAEQCVAALQSGRHVYCEKMLGFTIEHCNKIVEAVRRSNKSLQIGFQYRYAPWFQEAVQRIKNGEIGKVMHVYGYWHRNNSWRRPVSDPKLEKLINWRLYKDTSNGLMAELGSHHIDVVNWIFDSIPTSVTGSGGIDYWKDGREVDDNVQVTFRYPNGGTFFFSSVTDNRLMGNQLWIYGDKGSLQLTIEGGEFYYERERRAAGSQPPTGEVVERGVTTGATYSSRGEMPYRGPGAPIKVSEGTEGNPTLIACKSFIDGLRENKKTFANEQTGWDAGVSIILANKSISEGRRIKLSDYLKTSGKQATKAKGERNIE